VRSRFQEQDPRECRLQLGLAPDRPVLLVMGGSQGARAVNELVLAALPSLERQSPQLQILHITGREDFGRVQDGYAPWAGRAVVRDFLGEMELAMGAATMAISRAGGSALAEMAAMGLPSILIPYPSATDNHQFYNARLWRIPAGRVCWNKRWQRQWQLPSGCGTWWPMNWRASGCGKRFGAGIVRTRQIELRIGFWHSWDGSRKPWSNRPSARTALRERAGEGKITVVEQ
jgi:hypothetical protein